MPKRIGLLIGEESAFPHAFSEQCQRHVDVECELVKIGITGERHIGRYDVIIDRLSAAVPQYRSYLRACALAGTRVINDPFASSAEDAFFDTSLAAHLGLAVPRTALLPQKSYDSAVISNSSLQNLEFPLKWYKAGDYVGYPCVLRSAARPARVRPTLVRDETELVRAFDGSGGDVVMAQQHFEGATAVRCLCVGREQVLVLREGAPGQPPAQPDEQGLSVQLRDRLVADTCTLARALGYELVAVDFAVHGGVPYAVGPPDPQPELDPVRIAPSALDFVVDRLCELAVACARGEPRPSSSYLWRQALDEERGRTGSA